MVGEFSYDTKLLYDALIRSTDEYIYICNMKNGVYRYPSGMVKEFQFPREVIKNPLPYWKEVVHPDDWETFYLSNMEIGKEGKDNHLVEFRIRARDGEYHWVKCRGYLMRDEKDQPAVFDEPGILLRRLIISRRRNVALGHHLHQRPLLLPH